MGIEKQDLKPCPFACPESKPEVHEAGDSGFAFQIRCQYCGSRGPQESSIEKATAAWNRSAIPLAPSEATEAERAAVEYFEKYRGKKILDSDVHGPVLIDALRQARAKVEDLRRNAWIVESVSELVGPAPAKMVSAVLTAVDRAEKAEASLADAHAKLAAVDDLPCADCDKLQEKLDAIMEPVGDAATDAALAWAEEPGWAKADDGFQATNLARSYRLATGGARALALEVKELRLVLASAQECLSELGWHHDRGLLFQITTALAISSSHYVKRIEAIVLMEKIVFYLGTIPLEDVAASLKASNSDLWAMDILEVNRRLIALDSIDKAAT